VVYGLVGLTVELVVVAGTPFLALSNVIVTPHCAGTTMESITRAARMAAENVARVLSGRCPLHAVNPEVCTRLGLEVRDHSPR
jgi:phosphoglycerate dehydrogenase-like enzyme